MAHSKGFRGLQRLFAIAKWSKSKGLSPTEAEAAFEAALLDRRALLKGLAATAALAVVPTVLPGCDDTSEGTNDTGAGGMGGAGGEGPDAGADAAIDQGTPGAPTVAVVGAGIAGLHCAYRLKEAGVAATLYEAQDRVGGRMWTGRGLFPDDLLFEIGGELIDSNHATMFALAEELGIQLDDRWSFEKPMMVRETYYVNGARVSGETLLEQTIELADVFAAAYDAAENDDAAFEMLDGISIEAWLEDNVPAATYPELHAVLKVAFVGEFGLEADQQSMLNMLYLFGFDSEEEFLIFGESDERWHTHLGNDTFTTALATAIGADGIRGNAKLVKAAGTAAGPYTLTFEHPTEGTSFEVTADHIVLALPFTLLREVDLTDLELSAEKREIIAEIGYGTNAKVMGHFTRRPWWDDANESGLLTTDLGAQQGWDSTIGQAGTGDPGTPGIWTNFLGGTRGAQSDQGTPAEAFRVSLPDLETIWPGSEAAFSGDAQRMHWPTFAFSKGSYTCYRPGQWRFWSLEGVREGNVHFCGEHCSVDFQGWMEGAAETGGLVADEVLADLGLTPSKALKPWRRMALISQRNAKTGRVKWASHSRRLARARGR